MPVLPHLDVPFTVPCDKDAVILVSGHGTHDHVPVVFDVHGELPQQAFVPVDGPGIDVAVDAAAQQGSRVWQARPALQEDYLRGEVGLLSRSRSPVLRGQPGKPHTTWSPSLLDARQER